jgi:hypothetical protein
MRQFIAGDGSNSTAAVQAYLAANRQFLFADLYIINTAPQYSGKYLGQTFFLTDYPSPLQWSYKGTFKTAVISRGEVESKIGLEASTLDVTWTPQGVEALSPDVLAVDGTGNVLLTALQGFGAGIFDNGQLEVWRCVMPTIGDCNTYGACCMFGGRIGNLAPDRLNAKITVHSRLDALNVQVPTNMIEPGNVTAQYSPGVVPIGAPASLTIAAGSTATEIFADAGGSTPASDVYDGGYIVFTAGKLAGHYASLARQDVEGGHWAFYLEIPLPFVPQVGDTLTGYVAAAVDPAFPYVPVPINSAILIG